MWAKVLSLRLRGATNYTAEKTAVALVLQLYFPSRAASGFVMAGFGEGLVAATPERAGQRSFCRVECANDEAHEKSANLRHRQRDQ